MHGERVEPNSVGIWDLYAETIKFYKVSRIVRDQKKIMWSKLRWTDVS
jgi:hypothetical protein